jgi:hypothetical protein
MGAGTGRHACTAAANWLPVTELGDTGRAPSCRSHLICATNWRRSPRGLAADEAFLVAVKRMGSLDALSREFARAHSERLWKQLVIGPDGAVEPANTARAETLVVLILAVAAAFAMQVPALFGLRLGGSDDPFYARNFWPRWRGQAGPSTCSGRH